MNEHDRLRILHVSEVHWGGVVTLLRHYVTEQEAAGHDVHVLAPGGLPTTIRGATAHDWPVERNNLASFPRAIRALRQVVEQVQPDVVHLHSFVAGQLGRLPRVLSFARGRRPTVIYQPHAWSHELYTFPAASRGVILAERVASRRADVLVVNCNDEAERGRRLGVTVPAHPLGVAVDLERFRPPTADERLKARADLGFTDESVVLVLGRISHQKGQDLLVPRWRDTQRPGELLVLVGPGDPEDLSRVAGAAWGRSIQARGEPDDVLPWFWAADVLAMPSRYETVGLVSAEALATGVPVVATAFDGARETVLEGPDPAGAVVPAGDMDALLREVRRRLDDASTRRAEGGSARRRAERLFRPAPMAQRLENAYRDALRSTQEDTAR